MSELTKKPECIFDLFVINLLMIKVAFLMHLYPKKNKLR